MSTPWGVELDENILVVIDDNILVVVGNNDGDRAVLGLWDGLRLDAGLDLAVKDILDELGDVFLDNLLGLVVRVFGVVGGILNGERGPLLSVEVQISTVSSESLGVNGCEVESTLVLLGNGLQGSGVFLTLLRGLSEDIGEGNPSLDIIITSVYVGRWQLERE